MTYFQKMTKIFQSDERKLKSFSINYFALWQISKRILRLYFCFLLKVYYYESPIIFFLTYGFLRSFRKNILKIYNLFGFFSSCSFSQSMTE